MKIRNGFVSNSSSSSFCVYGASIDKEAVDLAWKKYTKQDVSDPVLCDDGSDEDDEDNDDYYCILETLTDDTGLDFDVYYDDISVGI